MQGEAIKIGVVGAGLIGQVEHIPNIRRLEQFHELVGVVDDSPMMRAEFNRAGSRLRRLHGRSTPD